MLVYKYVTPERIDILENGYIRFSQADALNDPFEAHPSFALHRKLIKERYYETKVFNPYDIIKRDLVFDKNLQDEFKKLHNIVKRDIFILSLTKKRNNLVMWSHYTNSHRGFVIGFDSHNSFFQDENFHNATPLIKVEYREERTIMPDLDEIFEDEFLTAEACKKLYFTKSIHWRYEEELRMIGNLKSGRIIGKDDNKLDIKVFDFPPECLKEITFGYMMKIECKQKISKIVESRYPHVELFDAQPSETNFDLSIKPYRKNAYLSQVQFK